MKILNDYMSAPFRMDIVEDKDEGGFVVSYPDLPGCITCGETMESAIRNAQDAKKTWIEAALDYGGVRYNVELLSDRLLEILNGAVAKVNQSDLMIL